MRLVDGDRLKVPVGSCGGGGTLIPGLKKVKITHKRKHRIFRKSDSTLAKSSRRGSIYEYLHVACREQLNSFVLAGL